MLDGRKHIIYTVMKNLELSIYQTDKKGQRTISHKLTATIKDGSIYDVSGDIADCFAGKLFKHRADKNGYMQNAPCVKGFSANKKTFFHLRCEQEDVNITIGQESEHMIRMIRKINQISAPIVKSESFELPVKDGQLKLPKGFNVPSGKLSIGKDGLQVENGVILAPERLDGDVATITSREVVKAGVYEKVEFSIDEVSASIEFLILEAIEKVSF
jgi:hypothetical protein